MVARRMPRWSELAPLVRPRRRAGPVDRAVTIDVSNAGRVESECLPGNAAGNRAQQRPILPGIQIYLSARLRRGRMLPRADQQVVESVPVDVAHVGAADAESVTSAFAA